MSSGRSPALRLRQGFVLLAGAIVFSLVVGSGPDTFYWTPLGIGLVYLASAVNGRSRGRLFVEMTPVRSVSPRQTCSANRDGEPGMSTCARVGAGAPGSW